MTSWNRRAGTHDQPGVADAAAKALDQQAMLRLSAAKAEPPAQLRARVLTSFAQRTHRENPSWTWLAAATAAAMAVAVVIGLGYWRLRAPGPPTRLPIAPKAIANVRLAAPEVQPGHVRTGASTRPRNQHRRPDGVQVKRPAASNDLPVAQFDSLLYCDPFSCGDPMQVIRLEMPAASVGRAYRSLARNGFVSAELIVGADGLTRAVRFTK